jgi:Domain of Unknown Function (DUF1543)
MKVINIGPFCLFSDFIDSKTEIAFLTKFFNFTSYFSIMEHLKLYMLLLGCTPRGRHIEQHDVFFSVGRSLAELNPLIIDFWPEAEGRIHVDGWREVTCVDQYKIRVALRDQPGTDLAQTEKLFFVNLGGYKQNEFEEFHYKLQWVVINQPRFKNHFKPVSICIRVSKAPMPMWMINTEWM